MSKTFPKWTNTLPLQIVIFLILFLGSVTVGITYYFTPEYTRVGYRPPQPVAFDHSLHAGQLGIDCRYCHSNVEFAGHANIPTAETCMNCHNQIKGDSPLLALVRSSYHDGTPIPWVRVHQAPDYVYFNHAVHVARGVSCYECHGPVNEMEVVWHDKSHSMAWCLDCHRHPEDYLRDPALVYDLDWRPASKEAQREAGLRFVEQWNVNPPLSCSGCHR
ncbi:MAG: cytochrome C [Puniceicoccaceae bacterium]|nr:MAG: cytochrome C [Puniceicoccaceae bacterium]